MSKVIDLTHILDPKKAQRKFEVETIGADEVNHNVVRMEGQWYIMSDIHMVSHIGTHIEVPYHLFKDAYDLATMPIDAYYGEGCVLDFSKIQKRVPITLEMAKEAAKKAGGIHEGDIVNFIGNGHYFSPNAKVGFGCNPGRAMVRGLNRTAAAKHPYKVTAVRGGGSTVNGWVDADAITAVS